MPYQVLDFFTACKALWNLVKKCTVELISLLFVFVLLLSVHQSTSSAPSEILITFTE